ncbi:MAG: hypothetical protein QS721_04760 [Candidatus Endonucleobacter sp. (ex Gigantidas childressi)]|nr:hypothetical protein [Candidatus Endonucleobacter sp. (ex Gigantidas childressi)]
MKNKLISLSEHAKLYLFGSRVDASKIGGGIDLLIVSDTLSKKYICELSIEFCKHFGEEKIGIILNNGKC